jgi:hypothetical protein
LVTHYLSAMPHRPARPDAARKLVDSYDEAVRRIEASPRGLTHPRPYPSLAGYGFRWIKVHRYWFGYSPASPPVITNIFDETSDIPSRMSVDDSPVMPA